MSELTAVLLVVLILGVNTLFWTTVGILRWVMERRTRNSRRTSARHRRRKSAHRARHRAGTRSATMGARGMGHRFRPSDVAVLIPAHNEAAVLENALQAAALLLPLSNIHVVSDGSTDETADVARDFGVHVLELVPNRGKAGALHAAIQHFQLRRRFRVVLFLDADTRLAPDYLTTALPEFDDPDVVAVAGRVKCLLDPPPRTRMGRVLVSYRSRLYAVVQLLVKYGQAARWANVVSIVPGFASMYRTDVLHAIDITAPGLVIEDFNMTFEVHAKRLGRIAFRPDAAVAYTQDPDTLRDYLRQIRRWSLGYWQTIRLHGLRARRFWLVLLLQIFELLSSSVLLVTMLPVMLFTLYCETLGDGYGRLQLLRREVVGTLHPQYVLIGFILPDVLLTVFAAIALQRPGMVLLAPLFPALRLAEAYVCLRTLPTAWRTRSSGKWVSPVRRSAGLPSARSELDGELLAVSQSAVHRSRSNSSAALVRP
jgi:biofilm PGA synthesis N-glycosyltransferase PgaC